MECAKGDEANGATAEGGAVSSEGRCDPVAGCGGPSLYLGGRASPPLPSSRFAGPSGNAPGRHHVALLGIVDSATTCVAGLVIIPILPATRSTMTYSEVP